jgi:hypothetical protein
MTAPPAPRAVVTEADIQAAFKDLAPGWYTTADLLPTFNEWAKAEGRMEAPAKILGQALRQHFSAALTRRAHGNVAIRYLDQDVLSHRAWFTES